MLYNEMGKSRGVGFVSFSSKAAAERCVEAENGASVDGRELRCNLANGAPARTAGGDRPQRGGFGGDRP